MVNSLSLSKAGAGPPRRWGRRGRWPWPPAPAESMSTSPSGPLAHMEVGSPPTDAMGAVGGGANEEGRQGRRRQAGGPRRAVRLRLGGRARPGRHGRRRRAHPARFSMLTPVSLAAAAAETSSASAAAAAAVSRLSQQQPPPPPLPKVTPTSRHVKKPARGRGRRGRRRPRALGRVGDVAVAVVVAVDQYNAGSGRGACES